MKLKVTFSETNQELSAKFSEEDGGFGVGFDNVKTIHGKDGKSAYEVALDNGFEGSEEEWLESLVGPEGPSGKDGADGYTPVKNKDYFDGKDGYTPQKGIDYFDGKDGSDGKDGATYIPTVSEDGTLTWSNDQGKANPDATNIRGPEGPAGSVSGNVDTILYMDQAEYDALASKSATTLYLIRG